MTDLAVAKEIMRQLGGQRFLIMTGCKHPIGGENELQLHLPRNASKANAMRIHLDASDTYTVKFYRHRSRGLTLDEI